MMPRARLACIPLAVEMLGSYISLALPHTGMPGLSAWSLACFIAGSPGFMSVQVHGHCCLKQGHVAFALNPYRA